MNAGDKQSLIATLKTRFERNPRRHPGISWSTVQAKIEDNARALQTLNEMERTGGEPDIIGYDTATDTFTFCDCASESPKDRRSLCYDRAALDSRKENKPGGNAIDMASALGVALLTEAEYRVLQTLGEFDCKTSSWVRTPSAVRARGGALFCDRRYNEVFVYHNGAESYYAARGFRGVLTVTTP